MAKLSCRLSCASSLSPSGCASRARRCASCETARAPCSAPRAIRRIAEDVEAGKLTAGDVTEARIAQYLDTAALPDPDLIIRTSGEQRLSNFLLWQAAYAEFYFPDVHWPDFDERALEQAFAAYAARDRRFGGLSAKVAR